MNVTGVKTVVSPGVLVEQGVVLDDDQGVAGLFKNGHELKDCEGSADLQVMESHFQGYQFSWRSIVVSSESCSLYYIFLL